MAVREGANALQRGLGCGNKLLALDFTWLEENIPIPPTFLVTAGSPAGSTAGCVYQHPPGTLYSHLCSWQKKRAMPRRDPTFKRRVSRSLTPRSLVGIFSKFFRCTAVADSP